MLTSGSAAQERQVDLLVDVVRAALAREGGALGLHLNVREPDLSGVDAPAFCAAVHGHRVSSLVAAHGDALGLPAAVMDDIQEQASQQALMAMTLALETPRVLADLADTGIPALAFKGVALSQLTTGTATERGGGDIDLLVSEHDAVPAIRLLVSRGMATDALTSEQLEQWWPLVRWSSREVLLLGLPAQVDLHWRVTKEHGVFDDARALHARGQQVEVLGRQVHTLGDDDTLLAACYHLYHDRYRSLRQAVDVVRLLRRRTRPVAWRGRQRAMAAEAARFAESLVGGMPPGHLDGLCIPRAQIDAARQQWLRHRSDPTARLGEPSLRQSMLHARDSHRHTGFVRELPRTIAARGLLWTAPRLAAPITAAGIVRAMRGPR